jgi:FKBP-type peptidyl-prolyl cis-trans isomerase
MSYLQVVIHYSGWLTKTKTMFDSSLTKAPLPFRLGTREVIKGWDIGIEGMKEGGRRLLMIPAAMA